MSQGMNRRVMGMWLIILLKLLLKFIFTQLLHPLINYSQSNDLLLIDFQHHPIYYFYFPLLNLCLYHLLSTDKLIKSVNY